jgi:hypothetical protein
MKALLPLIIVSLLYGCGGGGGGGSSPVDDQNKLTWIPPTTRIDGSYLDLSSISGYRVYYGTSDADLELLVDIADYSITEHPLDDDLQGSLYFCVTAYDVNGLESEISNLVLKHL